MLVLVLALVLVSNLCWCCFGRICFDVGIVHVGIVFSVGVNLCLWVFVVGVEYVLCKCYVGSNVSVGKIKHRFW